MHDFRKKNGLSPMEYILCDMIYHLSVNPNAPVKDWCSMTKEHIAKEIGISKQAVLNLIEKLILYEFLEKNEITKFLRTTTKWQEIYFTDSQESLPNSIYINNKYNIDIEQTKFTDGKETLPTVENDNSFDAKTEFLKEFNRVKCSIQPTRDLGDKEVRQLNSLFDAGYTIQDIDKAL